MVNLTLQLNLKLKIAGYHLTTPTPVRTAGKCSLPSRTAAYAHPTATASVRCGSQARGKGKEIITRIATNLNNASYSNNSAKSSLLITEVAEINDFILKMNASNKNPNYILKPFHY